MLRTAMKKLAQVRDTMTLAVVMMTVLVSTAASLGELLLLFISFMALIECFQQYSHTKSECTEARKMGACFNCGQEGWVMFGTLASLENEQANRGPVTPRLIAPSPEFSRENAASVKRKVTLPRNAPSAPLISARTVWARATRRSIAPRSESSISTLLLICFLRQPGMQ
jgi:hypothetical protein